MQLTVLRYHDSSVAPQAEVQVSSPQDALSLLRAWQRAYPQDRGLLLDADRRPIASTQPSHT